MKTIQAAIYARVSSERQATAQTIGSQLAALRERVTAEGYVLPRRCSFWMTARVGRPWCGQRWSACATCGAGAVDRLSIHSPDR